MDQTTNKQAEALRAQAEYLRTTAAMPAVDEYDVERLAEAEAFEAGASALDRVAAPRKAKTCAVCGAEFKPMHPLKVVCGKKCRKKYDAAVKRTRRRCDGKLDRAEMDRQLTRARATVTRCPRGWEADLHSSLALASGG